MIIDSLENAAKYTCIHPLFAKAFEYIASVDLANIEIGKYEISDGLLAIFSDKKGMAAAESIAKFECHNKNIDIQLCISGNETFGWKPRQHCTKLKGDYNADKDVSFYEDAPDMFFQLTDGQFAILFPEDVHAPMIAVNDNSIRKLVIKVRIG
jgi:YhcH/YjgK/YiaL family protein